MAFMRPSYTNAPFHVVTDARGETHTIPADVFGSPDRVAQEYDVNPADVETIEGKWWACLSAPGYMDCTDWVGPFDTEAEAREEISNAYDVDPDTGDDLHAVDLDEGEG